MMSTAFVTRPFSPTEARRPLIRETKSDSAPAERVVELTESDMGGATVVVEAWGAVVVAPTGAMVVGTGAVVVVVGV